MTTKTFITKENGSNYYMVSEGMGQFCTPPGHANRFYSVREYRGGHEVGAYSLDGAANAEYLPRPAKLAAIRRLNVAKIEITEEWIDACYAYFKNCYSSDGINRSASDCIVDNTNSQPAEYHLAYLMVKKYDPNHTPRLDLIANPPTPFHAL